MTEALFLADLDSPAVGDTVAVTGDEGRHAAIVRRIRRGEVVLVSDGIGNAVRGPVLSADVNGLVVEVAEVLSDAGRPLRFTVVQALAKGDRSELALEMLDNDRRDRVQLSAAPLIEGLIAASVTAAGGASPARGRRAPLVRGAMRRPRRNLGQRSWSVERGG